MSFVPAPRLLGLTGLLVAVAAVAGTVPGAGPLGATVLLLAAGAAVVDLLRGRRGTEWPRLSLAPVSRFAQNRSGHVEVTLAAAGWGGRRLRLGLAFPAAVGAEEFERWVEPGTSARLRLDWPCRPRTRGRYHGASACLETESPWGLWQLRRRSEVPGEFRIYPHLRAEGRQAAALFLPRAAPGARAVRTIGRGREFEKLREYLPGDGFDEIHWKASGKRSRPVTKVFQEERTQEIYVLVDVSRLSARRVRRGDREEAALERSLAAALSLLAAAERQGDRFGLMAFDERVRVFLPAAAGARHFAACRDAMLGLRASEAAPDLAETIRYLRTRLRRRALLFFLADLADPVLAEDFVRLAPLLTRQHLVLVGQLRAPEVAPLYSGDPVASADQIYGRLAGHLRWAEMNGVTRRLRPSGVTVAPLENETMAAEMVRRYLAVKRRQLL